MYFYSSHSFCLLVDLKISIFLTLNNNLVIVINIKCFFLSCVIELYLYKTKYNRMNKECTLIAHDAGSKSMTSVILQLYFNLNILHVFLQVSIIRQYSTSVLKPLRNKYLVVDTNYDYFLFYIGSEIYIEITFHIGTFKVEVLVIKFQLQTYFYNLFYSITITLYLMIMVQNQLGQDRRSFITKYTIFIYRYLCTYFIFYFEHKFF